MPLMNRSRASTGRSAAGGFSLIELMVAMVLGLIVIGAVIALVLSMMRANNQTIAATRLTQELRAVAALMSSDLRRAGGVIDPLTVATADAGNPNNPFAAITIPAVPNNTCIQFGYSNPVGEEGLNFHTISLSGSEVRMATAQNATPNCATGTRLSSEQVRVTNLRFIRAGRRIDITVQGCLSNRERTACDPTNPIARSYSQTVYVRSISGA